MSDQRPIDGEPVRLAPPFKHITVTYPFQWASPNRVHVFDERDATGTVYERQWAAALADGIVRAMGGRVVRNDDAALAAEVLEDALINTTDRHLMQRIATAARALGADLPEDEDEDEDDS